MTDFHDMPAASAPPPVTITVGICTYRRPAILDTLRSLAGQSLRDCRQRILVIDNDDTDIARGRIEQAGRDLGLDLRYLHAPGSNISIARNAGLDACETDWLAFIDDDEIAEPDWLQLMRDQAMQYAEIAAVFGPMQAIYGETAPGWLKRGDFQLVTRRHALSDPTQLTDRIYRAARDLFAHAGTKGPFRLIGVGISDLAPEAQADLTPDLLDPEAATRAKAERAADAIRARFGAEAIIKGRALR